MVSPVGEEHPEASVLSLEKSFPRRLDRRLGVRSVVGAQRRLCSASVKRRGRPHQCVSHIRSGCGAVSIRGAAHEAQHVCSAALTDRSGRSFVGLPHPIYGCEYGTEDLSHARASSRRGYGLAGPMVMAPFQGSILEDFLRQQKIKRSCQWVHRYRPRPS
ncbi:hypothetical protein EVAR_21696_1 [Eumeta japonica]|uniref:Uncharacterized protein n=1 Tax=Eumeta variegata TaxID=151549 RepID=A0A4C1W644_EUMVA|nr:hypothetical protein EVAR_21696_1 [Eumeta japonica]